MHPQLEELSDCSFIDCAEAVLLVGPQASGKTRGVQFLRQKAREAGHQTVLFNRINKAALNDALSNFSAVFIEDFIEGRGVRLEDLIERARENECSVVICAAVGSELDEELFDHIVELDDRRKQTGGER